MKALRIMLIAGGSLLLVRALVGGGSVSQLAGALSESAGASFAALAVVLIAVWGLVRLFRMRGEDG